MGYSEDELAGKIQNLQGKVATGLTYSSVTEIIEFLNATYFLSEGLLARLPNAEELAREGARVFPEWTFGDMRGTMEGNGFRLVLEPTLKPRQKPEPISPTDTRRGPDEKGFDSGRWFG
ncbi:hypothetical protein A2548_07495 [candidate division WOR-1 bacterium RIFOXYD2_FULL_41_8]|nr:MAG: hypothetical protein A2548_07495 [candidate division WOR-1 bacterium RIFOXYD2_FULL_41_8]